MGRATKGAAYGMKMRANLYQKEWDKVLEYANIVIDRGNMTFFQAATVCFKSQTRIIVRCCSLMFSI